MYGCGKKRKPYFSTSKISLKLTPKFKNYKHIPCTLRSLKNDKLQISHIIPNFQHLICREKLFLNKLNIYL